jgi:CRP-like cAMP-binding protein
MPTPDSPNSTLALLTRVPLLAGLPERELAGLADVTHIDHFEREASIFRQGAPCDRVWLLRAGEVKIIHQELDGREVILEVVSPGEVFGGAVLFMDAHPATAKAMTQVETVSFSSEPYARLLDAQPAIARKLIRMLGGRLHSMMGLQILAGERVERRLVHILLKLADMAGTTIETAIRTISRFRAQGWVATRRGG